jgi:hypothetical protein
MTVGEHEKDNVARSTVYAALELSKKSWVLAIAHPDRDRPSMGV